MRTWRGGRTRGEGKVNPTVGILVVEGIQGSVHELNRVDTLEHLYIRIDKREVNILYE